MLRCDPLIIFFSVLTSSSHSEDFWLHEFELKNRTLPMKKTIKADIFLIGLFPLQFSYSPCPLFLSFSLYRFSAFIHSCYTFRNKFTQSSNILQQILCQYNLGKTSSVMQQFCPGLVTHVMKFNHVLFICWKPLDRCWSKRITSQGLCEWPPLI